MLTFARKVSILIQTMKRIDSLTMYILLKLQWMQQINLLFNNFHLTLTSNKSILMLSGHILKTKKLFTYATSIRNSLKGTVASH
jgi:hypothetical protein